MGNINYGNQVIIWDYKYPARGADFSVSLKHTLKPGVYYGGTITGDASGNAIIAPLCIIIEDYQNSSIAVKISTSESFVIAVPDESTRYIYMYYTFAEDPYNYMDPGLAETLEEVNEKKGIILGAVTKVGTTLSVNYANKTWGQYDHTTGYYKKFITDQQIEVDLNDGVTSPFFVASNVLNTNLNADMVDDVHVSASPTLNTIPKSDSVEGKLIDGWIYGQMPVGGIMMYGGGSTTDPAPSITDFLYCDGSAISRTTFATLFSVIGTTFGTGDGSTTFNIPNFKAVVPRGMGTQTINTREKDGSNLGALLEDRIQQMTGQLGTPWETFGTDVKSGVFNTSIFSSTGFNSAAGSGLYITAILIKFDASQVARTGDYTRDNSLSVRFYIRYK